MESFDVNRAQLARKDDMPSSGWNGTSADVTRRLYSLCFKNNFTLCCGRCISRLREPIEIVFTPFKTRLQYQLIYVDIVFTLLAL